MFEHHLFRSLVKLRVGGYLSIGPGETLALLRALVPALHKHLCWALGVLSTVFISIVSVNSQMSISQTLICPPLTLRSDETSSVNFI